jgi:hypothetical protein
LTLNVWDDLTPFDLQSKPQEPPVKATTDRGWIALVYFQSYRSVYLRVNR